MKPLYRIRSNRKGYSIVPFGNETPVVVEVDESYVAEGLNFLDLANAIKDLYAVTPIHENGNSDGFRIRGRIYWEVEQPASKTLEGVAVFCDLIEGFAGRGDDISELLEKKIEVIKRIAEECK